MVKQPDLLLFASLALFSTSWADDRSPPSNPAPSAKEVASETAPSTDFRAYWLTSPQKGEAQGYRVLLVTQGPIERWIGSTLMPENAKHIHHVLDRPAFSFETYRDDSFWMRPFAEVRKIGIHSDPLVNGDKAKPSILVDDVPYTISPCQIADVIRLLDHPEGKQPLHRPELPLAHCRRTARAFRCLLQEQRVAQDNAKSTNGQGVIHLPKRTGWRTLTVDESRQYREATDWFEKLLERNAPKISDWAQVREAENKWIAERVREAERVKVGTSLADLEKVFVLDGGLSTTTTHRYVLLLCPYIKTNVEFENEKGETVGYPIPLNAKVKSVSIPFVERQFED